MACLKRRFRNGTDLPESNDGARASNAFKSGMDGLHCAIEDEFMSWFQ